LIKINLVYLVIEWDSLYIEMIVLAGIIWFAVYIEHWAYKRSEQQKDKKTNITF
jgi:formate hydrogenlyase subunit 3/multisubunit Na+/H+ antiporter MnhD subunit